MKLLDGILRLTMEVILDTKGIGSFETNKDRKFIIYIFSHAYHIPILSSESQ